MEIINNVEVLSDLPHKKEDNERAGDRLYEAMQLWENGIRNIRHGYLYLGKALYILKSEKLWRAMGNHILSWRQFCNKELHVSLVQANRLEQIYREVGSILGNIEIDVSKVTLLLPYLKNKTDEEKTELLLGMKDLTVEDVKNTIKDLEGKPETATDVCLHNGEIEIWNKCKVCGKMFKG